MRITILTFPSYCIYVALPDISAPLFFRTVRDWSEIIKTSSLPCPVVLRSILRQQNIGEVAEGRRSSIKLSATEETCQSINTPPLFIADEIGGVPAGQGVKPSKKHNISSFSILLRRDHAYSFWFSTEPNTDFPNRHMR